MDLLDATTAEPAWLDGWEGPAAVRAQLRFDTLLAAIETDSWGAHELCSLVACRAPLHPGPCKGWKHTLHLVSPGAWKSLEHARVQKLNERRLKKVAELKAQGKRVPPALLKPIEPREQPGTAPAGWRPGDLAPGQPAARAAEVAAEPSAKVGQKAKKAAGEAHRAGEKVAEEAAGKAVPGRATLKGHGDPTGGIYYGEGAKPAERGVAVDISPRNSFPGDTAKLLRNRETGKTEGVIFPAGKLWLAPDRHKAPLHHTVPTKGAPEPPDVPRKPSLAEEAQKAELDRKLKAAQKAAGPIRSDARGYNDHQDQAVKAAKAADRGQLRVAVSSLTPGQFSGLDSDHRKLVAERLRFEAQGKDDGARWAQQALDVLERRVPIPDNKDHELSVGEIIRGVGGPAEAPEAPKRNLRQAAAAPGPWRMPGYGLSPARRLERFEGLGKERFDQLPAMERQMVLTRLDELARGEGGPPMGEADRQRARDLHTAYRAPAPAVVAAKATAERRREMAASPLGQRVKAEIAKLVAEADKREKAKVAQLKRDAGIPSDAQLKKLPVGQRKAAEAYMHAARQLAHAQRARESNRAQLAGLDAALAGRGVTPQERADWLALRAEYEQRSRNVARLEDVPSGGPLHQELADARARWDGERAKAARIAALNTPGEIARALNSGEINKDEDTADEIARRRGIYAAAPAHVLAALPDEEKAAIARDAGMHSPVAKRIRASLGEIVHRPLPDNPDFVIREVLKDKGSELQLEHRGEVLKKVSTIRPEYELSQMREDARKAQAHLDAGRNVHGETPEQVAAKAAAAEAEAAALRRLDEIARGDQPRRVEQPDVPVRAQAPAAKLGDAAQAELQGRARDTLRRLIELGDDEHAMWSLLDKQRGADLDRLVAALPERVRNRIPAGARVADKRRLIGRWAGSHDLKDAAAIRRLGNPVPAEEIRLERQEFKRDRLAELGGLPGPVAAPGGLKVSGEDPTPNAWGGQPRAGQAYFHPDHLIGAALSSMSYADRQADVGRGVSLHNALSRIATRETLGDVPADAVPEQIRDVAAKIPTGTPLRRRLERLADQLDPAPDPTIMMREPTSAQPVLRDLFNQLAAIPQLRHDPRELNRIADLAAGNPAPARLIMALDGLAGGRHESMAGYFQMRRAIESARRRLDAAPPPEPGKRRPGEAVGAIPSDRVVKPAGAAGFAADRDALAASHASGVKEARKQYGGAVGDTRFVEFNDGVPGILKGVSENAGAAFGVPPVHQQDAEELAAELGRRIGLAAPAVHRVSPTEIAMQFSPGKPAILALPPKIKETRQAKLLDMLDYIIANADRHGGNWLIEDGKRIVPIDHGLSFRYKRLRPDQPPSRMAFTHFMYPEDNPATKADIARVERELEQMRPRFKAMGHEDWLEMALERTRVLARGAKGTTNIVED